MNLMRSGCSEFMRYRSLTSGGAFLSMRESMMLESCIAIVASLHPVAPKYLENE